LLAVWSAAAVAPSADAGLNKDGYPDLVFANDVHHNGRCLGDGAGGFTCDAPFGAPVGAWGVALGDLNRDDRLDVVFSTWTNYAVDPPELMPDQMCLGTAAGGFTCSDLPTDLHSNWSVALGDLDGDADLDIVFGGNQKVQTCLNDGSAGFTCDSVDHGQYSYGVALGDLNRDGDLDAVFARTQNQEDVACLGDGAGDLTCTPFGAEVISHDVALGHFDRDGKLDAMIAAREANQVCFGDGMGGFTCSDLTSDTDDSSDVALGDVDGDGDLDAVFANLNRHVDEQVCLNDGMGDFTCSRMGSLDAESNVEAVALGDVDKDGHLDAVLAISDRNRVCLGDGTGAFMCDDVATGAGFSRDVAIAPPTCRGHLPTRIGTPGPDWLTGTPGDDVIIGGGGDDRISTGSGEDVICAGPGDDDVNAGWGHDLVYGEAGDDLLEGAENQDRLDGGPGTDTITYQHESRRVIVNLTAGSSWLGDGSDTLVSIENVIGTHFNDRLIGDGADNLLRGLRGNDWLQGRGGDDTLHGGPDADTASYTMAPGPVVVNLASRRATGDGTDRLRFMENAEGSPHGDRLIGNARANVLSGKGGDDWLQGRGGNDDLRGQAGKDTVSFARARRGVTAVLGGTATGEGTDRLRTLEHIEGSLHDDDLRGNQVANRIDGRRGDDVLYGRKGADTLIGGPGVDRANGGAGVDTCRAETTISC
jgi:Ca2+-binding RTX toxin-like protein